MSLDHTPGAKDSIFASIHIAAIGADPRYLCEMITLGANMEPEDSAVILPS